MKKLIFLAIMFSSGIYLTAQNATEGKSKIVLTNFKTDMDMYVVRDIFYLKFGHYKDVKPLIDEFALKMEDPENLRFLTDFTGDSYRLIMELSFDSLEAYEKNLQEAFSAPDWQDWYAKFIPHINSSHREILKRIK